MNVRPASVQAPPVLRGQSFAKSRATVEKPSRPPQKTRSAAEQQAIAQGRVEHLLKTYFDYGPDRVQVKICPKEDPQYYMRTNLSLCEFFKRGDRRAYQVIIHPDAVEELDEAAFNAILIHELVHIEGYVRAADEKQPNLWQTIWANIRGGSHLEHQEKQTDIRALEKAYDAETGSFDATVVEGLKTYRRWIYNKLDTNAAIIQKKERYLTPEEIDHVVEAIESNPAMLAELLAHPPH